MFPSQIEQLLYEIEGVEPLFQIILTREEGLTATELKVVISPEFFSIDEIKRAEDFRKKIKNFLSTRLGLHAKITLIEAKSLERGSSGKIKRVIDLREDSV